MAVDWSLYLLPTHIMTKETSNKPVKQFRLRAISASIFENETEKGQTFFKVTVQRSYKTKDGFKSTNSFTRDDLPLVAELVTAAWRDILKREAEVEAQEG